MSTKLQLNAFTGTRGVESTLDASYGKWVGAGITARRQNLGPPMLVDPRKWRDPDVGWGLVLPTPPGVSPAELSTPADAPEPIQRLLAHRGNGPVLRYDKDVLGWAIRRYSPDGSHRDLAIVGSPRGSGDGALPRYLLIYGAPAVIPWRFQYRLGASSYVGRLDLEGQALENYVSAAETDWATAKSLVDRAVVWSVDHGGDITSLMKRSVAAPLAKALVGDGSFKTAFIDDDKDPATSDRLINALADLAPGLVVTTSHGMTGPLQNVAQMAAQLGLPVDRAHQVLQPNDVLASWQPHGAIWYAHACCSAGGDATTSFAGLVPKGTEADLMFQGIAACGAMVAPLPRALLGAPNPLRAFIGHVEPTTDWSLRQPETGQLLAASIVDAFYKHLYQPEPIGFAFDVCRAQASKLSDIFLNAMQTFTNSPNDSGMASMLATRLMAVDRESMVILGDPAATLPSLP